MAQPSLKSASRCYRILAGLLPLLALSAPSAPSAVTPEKQDAQTSAPPQPQAEHTAFFEKHIRPVLAEACYQCHSVDAQKNGKLKGGLFLDTRESTLKGGDTGPSLIPGNPKESLLLKAMHWTDADLQMPPKKQLPKETIALFEQWITMGAPDPRTGSAGTAKREINIEQGRQHWAFQPLAQPALPKVRNATWPKTNVDHFILAAQEAAKVQPAPAASPETLVRRLSFDLLGLPPKPEDVLAFSKDPSPEAYARLVDTLLQSPQYGERWGRHWLDVVRYAESGGYEFDAYRPGAYFYRDWVIRSLNADMPYNEFIRHQLAGDLLLKDKVDAASAPGFLVAGPYPGQITAKTKERIRYDQIDDMLSTIGSSMLGLTIGCVRCHDHKYDPLPQADYYNLAATLARTEHGEAKVERETPETERLKAEYAKKLAEATKPFEKFSADTLPSLFSKWRSAQPEAPAPDTTAWQIFDVHSVSTIKTSLEPEEDGVLAYRDNKIKDEVYTLKVRTLQKGINAFRLDALAGDKLPRKGPGLSDNGNFVLSDVKISASPLDPASKAKLTPLKLKPGKVTFEQANYPLSNALDNSPVSGWAVDPQQGKDHFAIFEVDGEPAGFEGGTELQILLRFTGVFGLGRFRLAFSSAPQVPDLQANAQPQDERELLWLSASKDLPKTPVRDSITRWFARVEPQAKAVVEPLRQLQRSSPKPDLLNIYSVKTGGADVFLLRRGEVDNKAAKADPGFLQVLSRAEPQKWTAPASTHPRVALGQWMTDSESGAGQLLARVMVNRVWKHHFGRALVTTPNDFGAQGEKPSHPELLEHLASEFIREGWSLKNLHRKLVLSAAYQQGLNPSETNRRLDPENKLFWQHAPRRLEAEAIRDSLLSVAGLLDLKPYGPSEANVNSPRRSVYLRVRRSELIPFLTLFDAPEALQSVGERGATTLPTQALTLLNSPFVRDCAQKLATRSLAGKKPLLEAFETAFQSALSRPPTAGEKQRFGAFLHAHAGDAPSPEAASKALLQTCLAILCTNEFIYVD